MKSTKLNLKPLNAVKKLIREDPEKFDMTYWVEHHYESCKTTHCIGGYLEVLYPDIIRGEYKNLYINDCSAELLGVSIADVNTLFQLHLWDSDLRDKYYKSHSHKQKARYAITAINRWMKNMRNKYEPAN